MSSSVKVRPPVRERWLTQARQGFPPPHLPSSSVLVRPSSAGVAEPATGTAVKCGNHAWDRPEAEALTWMLEASSVVASAVTVTGVGLAQAAACTPATSSRAMARLAETEGTATGSQRWFPPRDGRVQRPEPEGTQVAR